MSCHSNTRRWADVTYISAALSTCSCCCSMDLGVGLRVHHRDQSAVPAGRCAGAHPQSVLLQVPADLPGGAGSGHTERRCPPPSAASRKTKWTFCLKRLSDVFNDHWLHVYCVIGYCDRAWEWYFLSRCTEFMHFSIFCYIFKSQGSHDHSHGEHKHGDEDTDLLTEFDSVWKGLTALAGIYLLFIIEHCIRMVKHYKDHGVRGCFRQDRDCRVGLGQCYSNPLPSDQMGKSCGLWGLRQNS